MTDDMTDQKMKKEFEMLFEQGLANDCWPWQGRTQLNRSGIPYGYFKKGFRAARICYQIYCGPIPSGLVVRHKCDNSICVNPSHLELGTQKQNVEDRYKRGRARHLRGSDHVNSKLTESDVTLIRKMLADGLSRNKVAKLFGVSVYPIYAIANRKGWLHVR